MPVKFIHAADIHLDSPLEGLERYEGAPVEEIRGATRRAFENMVRLAIAEPVDFVLIAGDLYDGEWRDAGTGLYFIRQVVKLKEAGIPVFVVLGNHDAANKMTRELPLPDNVRLFSHRAPQTVTLDDLGVAVHGQSFARADITDDLAAGYPAPVADAFNIGLLHTCATGFAGHDRYAPTSVETLQQRGYQYWALGHVHTARTLSEKPPVVFPGNLQGRRVTEAGPKGCQVVTVHDDEIVERRFEPVDVVRWLALEVDVAGVAALDEAVNRVEEQLRHLVGDHPGRVLAVRVELRGECDAHQVLSARRGELLDKIHAIAADTGQGEIWIERLDLDTAKAGASQGHEGPFREVEIYADELAEAPGSLLDLAPELRDLLNILPAGLRDGESAPGLLDTESLQRALTEAQVLLSEKLIAREPAQ